jgi:hypothetical protein
MAWNESGTVGYVWFIGVRDPRDANDSGSNMGYQPIIYKTTNSGATWTEMPKINFNDTTSRFDALWETMQAVRNETYGVPFFYDGEGLDGIVDRNDRLHIVSTIFSHSSKHPDSLGYTWSVWPHKDNESYRFGHRAGNRPFIFDFTETNDGWRVTLIDSMSTEGPGTQVGDDGYDDNPWDPVGGTATPPTDKVAIDARIQLSRTPDGRYIVYTWAESDTGVTFQNHKWNSAPNVKARLAEIGPETSTATPATMNLHPMEINVTNPSSVTLPPYTVHNSVKSRATMHYVSSKCAVISSTLASGVAIGLPITVSNSSPYKQLQTNNHWYLSANLNFGEVPSVDWPHNECAIAPKEPEPDGVHEVAANISNSVLYPNPASSSAQLSIGLDRSSDVNITIVNTMGQAVSTVRHKGTAGGNNINLDLSNLAAGVYMVNIKVGDATGTKRLLIQQ